MASYIEGALIKNEKVVYTGHVSLWTLAPLILLGFLLLAAWGIGLVFWLVAFIRYKTTELAFTNKRVIAKFGFISRHTVELNISKVESIQVSQGMLGRIFDFGTLVISGAGNPQTPISGISNPMAFAVRSWSPKIATRNRIRNNFAVEGNRLPANPSLST